MPQKQAARRPYVHGALPPSYDAAAVTRELVRLEQALAPFQMRTVTTDTIATVPDHVILCDATAAAFGVTLPDPARVQWMAVTIKKVDPSAHAVTIVGTVDGALNPALTAQYQFLRVQSDGTAWWTIG